MSGMGSRIFFRTSLVPSITYILAIKIAWAVFEKIYFFYFLKFDYNFCKQIFFELILGVHSSRSGSHLPSQYGSNPSGNTQTMLILLRPYYQLFLGNCERRKFSLKNFIFLFFIYFTGFIGNYFFTVFFMQVTFYALGLEK